MATTSIPVGQQYFGYHNGSLTEMIYLQKRPESVYLMAIPVSGSSARSREVRTLQGSEKVVVEIIAVSHLRGLRKGDRVPVSWTAQGIRTFSAHPRVDDLEAMIETDLTALPMSFPSSGVPTVIFTDTTPAKGAQDTDEDSDMQGAGKLLGPRLADEVAPLRLDDKRMDLLERGQEQVQTQLSELMAAIRAGSLVEGNDGSQRRGAGDVDGDRRRGPAIPAAGQMHAGDARGDQFPGVNQMADGGQMLAGDQFPGGNQMADGGRRRGFSIPAAGQMHAGDARAASGLHDRLPDDDMMRTSADGGTGVFNDLLRAGRSVAFEIDPNRERRFTDPARGLGMPAMQMPAMQMPAKTDDTAQYMPTGSGGVYSSDEVLRMLLSSRAGTVATGAPTWKCPGATGQVQHNRLWETFQQSPRTAVEEFEECVRRLDFAVDGSMGRPSMSQIVDTYRNNAPLKEYPILVRFAETLLHLLTALRSENHDRAEALICLSLATLDQAGRDGGKFHRAGGLSMLPEPPVSVYRNPPSLAGKTIGQLGSFASLERMTIALGVYKDATGVGVNK